MAGKIIINCETGDLVERDFTDEEIAQTKKDATGMEELRLTELLIPTEKEILMAEIEIQTIQILTEGGLL